MPDWFKYYQQLAPLIKNLQGGYNGLLPTEDAPIPEETEVPPVEELKSDYTIQGIPTEERGPGMNNWSPGINQYDTSSDPVDKATNFMQKIPGLVGWLGDEIHRTTDAASSRLVAGNYDLRNKYSAQNINTYGDLSNLRYDAFSKKPIQDEYDKFSKNRFRNVVSGAIRGYMTGSNTSSNINNISSLTSLFNNGSSSFNLSSLTSGNSNSSAGSGTILKAITTAAGTMNSIAQNIIGGHKYNRDLGYIDALNNQNKLAYNNTLSDANRNINYNLNTSMNKQRQMTYALGGQIDNSEIAGVTQFNVGGTHEANPNGGIPQGIGNDGNPNLVEEGEVKWNDFIFSKRIKPQEKILKQYNSVFKGTVASYADAANKILDMHKERENNPFDLATLNVQMRRLADAQEYQKIAEEAAQYGMTPEEYVTRQQQLVNNQNNNSFAEGGPLRKIKGVTQAKENWDPQLQRPYYYADQAGNPAEGPNKYTKHTYWNHQVACDIIRSFAGRYQRYEEAAKALTMYTNQYNELAVLLGDPNRMAQMQVTADDVIASMQQAWNGIQDSQNRYDTYKHAFDYSRLLVQNVFAYYKALDNGNTGTGSHTWRLRSYLENIGHFDGTAKDSDGSSLYLTGSQLYRNYCVNKDAEQHFEQLKAKSPSVFNNIHTQSRRNSGVRSLQLGDPGYNKFLWNGKSTTSTTNTSTNASNNNTSTNTNNTIATPTVNTTNVVYTTRIPTTLNNEVVVRYYDPAQGKFVNADPNNPNLYKITNVKGTDGNISYDDNPNFVAQRDQLSDDDWNNILNNLKSKYGSKYNNYNIDDVKEGAQDGKFGNIHREVAQYINDNPKVESTADLNDLVDIDDTVIEPTTTNTDTTITPTTNEDNVDNNTTTPQQPLMASLLRGAPILNNIRQILEQNGPDYTYSNQLKSLYRPEEYRPVGQYQRYQPVDQHYIDTQVNQQRNTQYGFYRNNAQSQAVADMYATMANASTSRALTQAYLSSLQQNNQNRNAAIAANNQLDLQNEANRMNVQRANNANYANIMGNAYAAAEQERLAVENAREGNYNNLAENLGNLGRELYDRWRINNDPSMSYKTNWQYKETIPMWNAFNEFMQERNR